jgi:hypothetical protein
MHFGLSVNVNKISYLVGKPFILLSSLSEKLCLHVLGVSEDACLFSIVEEFYTLFYAARFARLVLMCDYNSADVRQQAQRRKVCLAGAASTAR